MTALLCTVAIALILLTAWRHWAVVRFFRRTKTAPPAPTDPPRLVSILQPILSGDPTLPLTLAHNVAARSSYAREFIWLVDEDDPAGQRICNDLIAAHPAVAIRLLCQPAPPQGVNPKTFKLIAGLAAAHGDIICVLDDDTMLPDHGLEQCLPYLDQPGAGLAFGLPYQVNFDNAWSGLIALFVNANSLPTYVPYASLHEPVTINGMFYALRRSGLDQMGGFTGLEGILADDFAVAQRVRTHGLHLVQTPLRHAISTQVPSPRRYLSLMQRWFIFPRESLLRHLPWREQALVYALALDPHPPATSARCSARSSGRHPSSPPSWPSTSPAPTSPSSTSTAPTSTMPPPTAGASSFPRCKSFSPSSSSPPFSSPNASSGAAISCRSNAVAPSASSSAVQDPDAPA